jgi:hypothetical protein
MKAFDASEGSPTQKYVVITSLYTAVDDEAGAGTYEDKDESEERSMFPI